MSKKSAFFAGVVGGIAGAVLTVAALGSAMAARPALFAFLLTGRASAPSPSSAGTAATQPPSAPDVSDVVARVNPAVVSIVISKDVPVMQSYFADPFGPNDPFGFQVPMERQNGTKKQDVGGGSGFLISADGYVVTNAHVVSDASADYTVFTNDGKKYPAKVIAADATLDVAVVKIDGKGFPFLTFGDSSKLKLGQSVIAIGNALGEFRNTVSVGVVSGLSRSIVAGGAMDGGSESLSDVIQTDAAINPGNSGGPLLALDGEVVGVNVAEANGAQNIGFSLPADTVKAAVASIEKNGRVIRPFLGVRYVPVTAALQQENNLSVDYGALVARGSSPDQLAVLPGSPADKAGLVENDIILEVDGQKIDDAHTLPSLLAGKKPGDKVTLRVQHHGSDETLTATLSEAPKNLP